MDLRPRVVVVQRGEKTFALRTHPLGKVVVHFVVEKDQDAMAGNLKLRGQVAVDPVKGSGMVVVAVQERDRTGQRREAFPNETEVLHPEGDQVAVVHPVKGVVDKIAGYDREVRRFRADAFHGLLISGPAYAGSAGWIWSRCRADDGGGESRKCGRSSFRHPGLNRCYESVSQSYNAARLIRVRETVRAEGAPAAR